MIEKKGAIGIKIFEFEKAYIASYGSAVGKREKEGPLGCGFDIWSSDDTFGEASFEKAEVRMQSLAYGAAAAKAKEPPEAIVAGDLMNQCTASSLSHREQGLPYIGLYGACSTMALALLFASTLVSAGAFGSVASEVSSHNCTAERQYRSPVEYGSQRTPTSQWTVTASAAIIVAKKGSVALTEGLFGRIKDEGINDANNMGAAMAPAAADTLFEYMRQTKRPPADAIFTGDLGFEGADILRSLMKDRGILLGEEYKDCGELIYGSGGDIHSGGSGCGCSAAVLAAYILPNLEKKRIKSAIFIGTGALHSPTTLSQGESIPGIAHLIRLEGV